MRNAVLSLTLFAAVFFITSDPEANDSRADIAGYREESFDPAQALTLADLNLYGRRAGEAVETDAEAMRAQVMRDLAEDKTFVEMEDESEAREPAQKTS